jgi:protein SCO1/2
MKALLAWWMMIAASMPLVATAEDPAVPTPAASSQTSLYALDASWTRQTGEKLDWKKSSGTPRVLALGYASCKGVCPRIIADMQRIEQKLTADELARCRFTFVTLDPAHDTVAEMKKLGERHKVDDTRWDLLTGEEDSVLELAVALGIRYDRLPNGIDFAHSYLIAVIGPDGVIRHKWLDPGEGPDPSVAALRGQGGK